MKPNCLEPIPAPQPSPPLRLPEWPLPAYRYVPGLNPHPFRHPLGHSYCGGQAPELGPWDGQPQALLRGLDLFEQRYVWECHEHYEGLWHQVPRGSVLSWWFQGLIQAAAASLKQHMGQPEPAQRLREAASTKLLRLEGQVPLGVSVDLPGLLQQLRAAEPWPLLR